MALPTYQQAAACEKAVAISVKPRVWWGNWQDLMDRVNAASPTATITDNKITALGAAGLLNEFNMGEHFQFMPKSESFVDAAGHQKQVHSAILQFLSHSAATDLIKTKLMACGKIFLVYEIVGLPITEQPDAFKALGLKWGMKVLAGGGVDSAQENGGATLITFSTDTERYGAEDYSRYTVGVGATYDANLAAIVAAEVA